MTELTFTGIDMRWLFETLVEACEVTRREGTKPIIVVNGKEYGDLLRVAALLPDEPLPSHHQLWADELFKKRQEGYRHTAYNIAHRANQIASDNRKVNFLMRMAPIQQEEREKAKIAAQTETACQARAARALLDMTQEEFAKAVGLARNTIDKIERGTMNPSKKTVGSIQKSLLSYGVALLGPRDFQNGGVGVCLRKVDQESGNR